MRMATSEKSRRLTNNWKGLWIWGSPGHCHEQRNTYCYLRRSVRLPAAPRRAHVRISADNRYQLFVNGNFVCRGPARCEPAHQSYDEVDLAPFLRKGDNCLAVLAHHYGESTFQSRERGGWGFLLDGVAEYPAGKSVDLSTGQSWKGIRASAYNPDTSRYTVQLAFQEDFDAAASPGDWTAPRFDDRSWPTACIVTGALEAPFGSLEPRGIPFEHESEAVFARMGACFTGRCGPGYRTHRNIGMLLADEKRVLTPPGELFRDLPAALTSGHGVMTVLPTKAERFAAVVIDAGQETAGFLHLDVEAAGGEIIDFFFCEHVTPEGDAILRSANGSVTPMADRYRCRKGRQHHRFFAWKGFRYALAVFRDVRSPLKVHHLGYTFTGYPVERRGSFSCSDPLLDRIWETGAYTQLLCMHDAYMDCPWREQAQWWGDARVQWRVNMAAFGDQALFKRGLRQAAQSQSHLGLTYGLFPTDTHNCILPDYTLVWICSLWDYYFYSADDEPLREHYAAVEKALAWFKRHAGTSHLCGWPGYGLWLFLDWAPLFKGGYSATFSLQYLEALQTAAKIAAHLGRREDARRYLAEARAVERAIVRTFWDPKGRQFYEGFQVDRNQPYRQVSQHAQTYAILTGVKPRHTVDLVDKVVWIYRHHDELFEHNAGGNIHHPKADHPIASSFFYAWVLLAMFRCDRGDHALGAIRKLWGRMLEQGATTWYESWNHGPELYGNSSACHAWSAGPTWHLSEQLGGITPLEPGFRRVRIAPRMFDLDHAAVRTPTPRGEIEVQWERVPAAGGRARSDAIHVEVKMPRGVRGTVDLPGAATKECGAGRHHFEGQA